MSLPARPRAGVLGRRAVLAKQVLGHQIDALIGALRGEIVATERSSGVLKTGAGGLGVSLGQLLETFAA